MNLYTPILITAGFVISSFTMAAPPADDLLAGPSIEAEEVTSQDMTDRVLKEQSKSKKVGSRQQSQIWRTALKVIDLTKDQEMEIDKIMEEFQKRNQIFRSTHGKEIRSIRDEYGNKKRDVLTTILTGAPKDKALIPEASQKRMLELMELAPDAKVSQEKAWVLLTAQQQKKFQSKYQELLDEEAKRKEANKNKDMPMDESKKRETVIPQKRMLDDAAVRRINFLRKLQGLQDD
jgi:Spy/CpxP family protein refolding chaperone